MSNGFIVLSRKMLNWEWKDDPNMVALWVHILLRCNWKDDRLHGHDIPRGSFLTSYYDLSKETGIPKTTVVRCIQRMIDSGEIRKQRYGNGTLITAIKYKDFQDRDVESGTQTEQKRNESGTQTERNRNQITINNKNNKETKKQYSRQAEPPTWEEVESYAYAIGYIDPLPFYRQMENSGWTYKGEPVKDWRRLLKGFKRQQDMDRSKAMASHQCQTEHLPEYMKQPQPEPEGTDQELMAEMLEWQRKNGGQT